jgi:hypothetical protein
MMKKVVLSLAAVLLFASEVEFGSGKFKVEGEFLGLNASKEFDIKSYSLVEFHKNIFKSNFFYKYNLTYFRSETLDETEASFNSFLSTYNLPTINYKARGLDLDIVVGRDLYKNKNSYFGVGALVGVSIPWLESKKSSSSDSDSNDEIYNSKTKFLTYKIGPSVVGKYAFNRFFSIYADAKIAYQMAKVKNDYVDKEVKATGRYNSFDIGIRFTPFRAKKKIGFVTLKPKLYATLGFRYRYWKFKNIESDVIGIPSNLYDLNFKTKIFYLGLGYDF